MNKKMIGDLAISDVLLGSELFGTAIDEKTSFRLMERYLELGGNCVDTARLYGMGRSEETVGRWIRAARQAGKEVYVSTKGGIRGWSPCRCPASAPGRSSRTSTTACGRSVWIRSTCIGCTGTICARARRRS